MVEESDTIVGVGDYLTSLLTEKYGYQVMHIKEAFDMMSGELDRNKAYDYACDYVEKVLEENPSVEVVIDLHRDGVDEDRRLVTEINGKTTAQILFYNGLSYTNTQGQVDYLPNPYIPDNLAFSFQLEYQAALYYPDFYRGIYLAGLRYNLHLRKRSLLLEAGAQTNTVQEVKNAYFSYTRRGKDVIDGLDFNADFGRIHAICGANGSGKTTLFKLISGLKTLRDGKIYIDGKRISSYKSGALYRNLIASLPQDPHDIFICESVKEDISASPDGEKNDFETVKTLCKRLNIFENLLDLHPYDLSGGEIQRAALVKLLLLEPKILLLDEPTKGLDKRCKRQLSTLLKELAAEGKAVIFITHDMDFIAETADDVTLIFGGKAVSSLPVRQFIMQNSVYTTAASLIGRGYFDKTMTDYELISSAVSRKNERGDGDE